MKRIKLVSSNQLNSFFKIARGLPNHFSSSDPRTVELAKFLCELITETMKLYEKRIGNVPDHVVRPSDNLCREVLGSFHKCKVTSRFWFTGVSDSGGAVESSKMKHDEEDKSGS